MALERKKLTYADYQDILELPDNADKVLELVDGEIVEKMASFEPSQIAGWFLTFINMYLLKNPIGRTSMSDGGYILDDENTLIPDVGYISNARMPDMPPREAPVPPDLAIEVKSPTDRKRTLRRKAEKYLAYGTKLVWLVFPEDQLVEVYTTDDDVKVFGMNDVLDGGDVLPGFTLAVKDVFK
jgi:Uma2 family endonuclease